MQQTRHNSISDVETQLATLHPDQEVAVIADRQFYYVEEPGLMIRNWERLIYEGPASKFTREN